MQTNYNKRPLACIFHKKIKSIVICLFFLSLPFLSQGQWFLFSENFDDLDISGWTFYNLDEQEEIVSFPDGNPWGLVEFDHDPDHPLNSPLIGSCSHF